MGYYSSWDPPSKDSKKGKLPKNPFPWYGQWNPEYDEDEKDG